ncbi:MAG: SDR family oxidoreductase, partial [Nevskiaceae bacterium]
MRGTPYLLAIAAVVLAALAALAIWRFGERAAEAPSVAVLPFTNPDPQREGTYFTDGFHDAIISQLARIQGLKVISRTSVLAYRGPERDFARIAQELGVEHLVEGSVQRAGERLRVSARLVAAASGKALWSAEYDRAPADVFSVQADMARQIAEAIDARLTLEEEARLEQAPTRDLAAYELYLRALEIENRTPPDKAALTQALAWVGEALQRDPDFALAHALGSRLHMIIYWVVGEYDKARLPAAHDHARRAVELAPQLAESHLAMALYWYWGHREYERALASLGDAQALEPNSSAVSFLTGSIYRRLARWDVSISAARKAAQLDPRHARNLQVYSDVLIGTRDFAEAERVLAALGSVAPRSPLAFLMRLQNQMRRTGDAGALAPDFTRFQGQDDPYCLARLAQYELLMLERRFKEAAAAILACPGSSIGALHNVPAPKEQYAAIAEGFAGNGAVVVGVDLDPSVRDTMDGLGGRHTGVVGDVGDPAVLDAAFRTAAEAEGGIATVVLNAGVTAPGETADYPVDQWDRILGVNLRAAFLGAKASYRYLQPGASIVMISSICASQGFGARAAYCASKSGVDGLVRALAVEWAPFGIRV